MSGSIYFWDAPYRPFFLVAAVWALVAIAWWPLGIQFGLPAPRFEPVVLWHVHELIFGSAGAAVAGYVLTALPSWVDAPPERGAVLKALVLCWILSRCAVTLADLFPVAILQTLNALYFLLLGTLILLRTLSGGALSRALFGVTVLLLGTADALFMSAAKAGNVADSLKIAKLCLIGLALLITAVGTRLIPAFTHNWRALSGRRVRTGPHLLLVRKAAVVSLMIAWLAFLSEHQTVANAMLILAALFLGAIMRCWQSLTTLGNPLIAGLHFAFFWLPPGLALIGALWFIPVPYPESGAFHAVTIGAMSGLIMAISGRAVCHTHDGELRAGPSLTLALVLLWGATWMRLAAPVFTGFGPWMMTAAALLWCAGWGAYLIGFRPALWGPAVRPVFSGKRRAADHEDRTPGHQAND